MIDSHRAFYQLSSRIEWEKSEILKQDKLIIDFMEEILNEELQFLLIQKK